MRESQDEQEFTRADLLRYAEGTVGRAFYDFLAKHGFKDNEYAVHDIIHVITGLPPTPAGEEVAFVYDYILRNRKLLGPEELFDRVILEVANIRASIPKIAHAENRPLTEYRVACEDELRTHFNLAGVMSKRMAREFGKKFPDMSLTELFELPMSSFDECREIIAETRDAENYRGKRVLITPPENPTAMLECYPAWVMEERRDINTFNGTNAVERLMRNKTKINGQLTKF